MEFLGGDINISSNFVRVENKPDGKADNIQTAVLAVEEASDDIKTPVAVWQWTASPLCRNQCSFSISLRQ